jgi:hypothetical protein
VKAAAALPVLGALIAGLLMPVAARAADEYREQRIKTAFLVNFAGFVTWPPGTFADATSPIELCILANDAFGTVLADIAKKKQVDQRPLRISRVFNVEDMRRCHIAYLEDASAASANLAALAGYHVLTVYEQEATQNNGVIRFFLDNERVRFEINIAAARRENLQMNSKLVNLARVVGQ